jgi:anti-anti-sigma regulatory factor
VECAIIRLSPGQPMTIEANEELDLRSTRVFAYACTLARTLGRCGVRVDLGRTRDIRGSGLALLVMLRQRLGGSSHAVRLVNCSPELRRVLAESSVGMQFQLE